MFVPGSQPEADVQALNCISGLLYLPGMCPLLSCSLLMFLGVGGCEGRGSRP